MRRELIEKDVGKVFGRDGGGRKSDQLLIFRGFGQGKPAICSFVTFSLKNAKVKSVGDMGYFNGPWFREIRSLDVKTLKEVRRRYKQFSERRRKEIKQAVNEALKRTQDVRVRCGKPKSWQLIDDGQTPSSNQLRYVIWLTPSFKYAVELYNEKGVLLKQEFTTCSYEPRFGMDTYDSEKIYGPCGVLEKMVSSFLAEQKE